MTKFSSPVPVGSRYTSGFMTKARPDHAGADWAPPKPGQHVDVYAVADGKVTAAGTRVLAGHTGKIVIIDHGELTGNGSTDHTLTNYGHLHTISVKRGQQVKAGQKIGTMGETGNATGVHLHLGVRFKKDGTDYFKWSDPKEWLATKKITPGKTKPVSGGNGYSKAIERWQRSMNKLFPAYANFAGDGIYGPYSGDVTREFQSRVGLEQTGKLDAATKKTMRSMGVDI